MKDRMKRCGGQRPGAGRNRRNGSGPAGYQSTFIRQERQPIRRSQGEHGLWGVFLSEALTGDHIMPEKQDDDLEAIIFNGIILAYYHRKLRAWSG